MILPDDPQAAAHVLAEELQSRQAAAGWLAAAAAELDPDLRDLIDGPPAFEFRVIWRMTGRAGLNTRPFVTLSGARAFAGRRLAARPAELAVERRAMGSWIEVPA